jgi:hypothetical protein
MLLGQQYSIIWLVNETLPEKVIDIALVDKDMVIVTWDVVLWVDDIWLIIFQ